MDLDHELTRSANEPISMLCFGSSRIESEIDRTVPFLYILLLRASFLVILFISSSAFSEESAMLKPPTTISYKDLQPLGITLSLLKQADLNKRDSQIFVYNALAGMIEGFDRYSYFVSPDLVPLFLNGFRDEYTGIGIHVARTEDRNVEVVAVEEGSPAETAGIIPKDVITALDGIQLKSITSTDISRLLIGPDKKVGSEIRVLLQKTSNREESELVLKRSLIKIRTIESRPLENSIGYIRLYQFRRSTPKDLKKVIVTMRNENQIERGLILDLRNNPGGEILASVDVARLFIDGGIIASTESNLPDMNVSFKATGALLTKEPLVVIVNEGSASGAELVAGAIKFHRRGTIIGQKTFGKGTFQSFVPITNEMGAYLTLGKFRLPDGTCPEGHGIMPDRPIESIFDIDIVIAEARQALTNTIRRE